MKKALVFDPYLDTLGGGERYVLTAAKVLQNLGFNVNVAWKDKKTLSKATTRFGINLENIGIDPVAFNLLSSKGQLLKKAILTRKYDLVFFLSDGSIPFLLSKRNLLHLQAPLKDSITTGSLDKLKIKLLHKIVYNSAFTQSFYQKRLPNKGVVIYPPIDTDGLKSTKKKENTILAVGRFDSPSHPKRHDILIEVFEKLTKKTKLNYKLILVGGLKGENEVVQKLKKKAKGLAVEFIINPSYKELISLYARAKIFWHAAGFGIDELKNPDRVEHFGMTTVEAMAAGCVPIVHNKGGQKEIITPGTGFLWNTVSELVKHTLQLIKQPNLLKQTAKKATIRSKMFGIKAFKESFVRII